MIDAILSALYLLTGVDGPLATLLNKEKMKQVRDKYKKLASQIAADQVMANNLYEAARTKNTQWMSELIASSPYGTRANALRSEIRKVQAEIKDTKSKVADVAKRASDMQYDMEQDLTDAAGSGSAAVDLAEKAKAEVKDWVPDNIKEDFSKTTSKIRTAAQKAKPYVKDIAGKAWDVAKRVPIPNIANTTEAIKTVLNGGTK